MTNEGKRARASADAQGRRSPEPGALADPDERAAAAADRIDLGASEPAADGLRSAGARAQDPGRSEAARRGTAPAKRAGRCGAGGRRSRPSARRLAAGGRDRLPDLLVVVAGGSVRRGCSRPRPAPPRGPPPPRRPLAPPPRGGASPARVAQSLGLAASVASTVEQATRQSNRGAGALLAIGVVLMLYTSMSLVRALRVAHVLAWEVPFRRGAPLPRDGAIFTAAIAATFAVDTGITYLRHEHVALSLLLVPLSFAITGGAWLGLSMLLPHGEAHWRALLPGAALLALGHIVLQVATVYYFAPKLTKAPALYGSLGTAATLLLWLFLIARIIVAAAFLNAALWRRSGGAA